jgi:hypothetical protein
MAKLPSLTRKPDYTGSTGKAVPKENPVRSEAYRRLVAAFPCASCGLEGPSQAAHPNANKAKGMKADDRLCFALCADQPGRVGCHALFDRYELYATREQHVAQGERWGSWTRGTIIAAGQWPANLPRWEDS